MVEQNVIKEVVQEHTRGPNGILGTATASKTVKQMWHSAHFNRFEVGNKQNPNKKIWVRHPAAPSLKRFVRDLIKSGNQVAKDFMACKAGALNSERTDANKSRIALEASASMSARKKKSSKSGKTAATP